MTTFIIKVLITAILVAAISELGKRSTFAGALLASLPPYLTAGPDVALPGHARCAASRRTRPRYLLAGLALTRLLHRVPDGRESVTAFLTSHGGPL